MYKKKNNQQNILAPSFVFLSFKTIIKIIVCRETSKKVGGVRNA